MFADDNTDTKCTGLKAEVFLSEPKNNCDEVDESDRLERASCSYSNSSDRFRLKDRTFRQFAQIYAVRLMTMRKKLAAAARKEWGSSLPIRKLSELKHGEPCIIVGTLFKKMELKPSILKEISAEENLLIQPVRAKYADDEDVLVMEDETQRVVLTGNIPVGTSISGTVMSLKGYTTDEGKFQVESMTFSGLPYQVAADLDKEISDGEDRYLAIISCLGFGSKNQDILSLQMLTDLITGDLGSKQDQESSCKIVRLIIAGNSLSQCTQDKESETKAKYLTRNIVAGTVDAIKEFDDFALQLAECIPVDVMAGEFDPTNHNLPQQPLHPCMFPKAIAYPTMQSVTNPYEAVIGGVRVLGTSGQNVNDIYRVTTYQNNMDILEQNMISGHIAPTAPDTLGCYPYYDEDPFILDKCPHLYFVGNQPKYDSKILTGSSNQKILLVMVPDFSTSKTCVLVNLRTMTCRPLKMVSSLGSTKKDEENEDELMEK
ncbi:DNA polymerase delta subunit 2 [Exaiptasia diaphana]|uniref:DNA polymerase delta subunit 2 n=1 Tax=Exaiptasia diaphana TaxID=2652724 RepID=A0A913XWY0_EXADI|nr:DNA polymerase delta subunit 2 [Exaiptasia diaphana]KXJ08373.1 DNA polymerase delta subunit 2 [Exaiptasia diaphana]